MIRLRPDIPRSDPSSQCIVVVMNELERNILVQLLHHPILDDKRLNPHFSTLAVRRFREMAHELERV